MKALPIIQLAAREFNDIAYARVAKDASADDNGANWLDWLNDAQRAIVLVRPDANAVTESFQLAAGTKQSIPAGATRLLDVTRNMGSNGTTAGKTIRFADRGVQDQADPDWHNATASTVVKDVLYDDRKDPTTFWTSPPVHATTPVYIEAVVAKPADDLVDADNDDFGLADVYAPAAVMWMKFRAYGMASQSPSNAQKSKDAFVAFFNLLGVKVKAEMFFASNAPAQLPPEVANGGR